ncbi:MAG: PorT family protein [Bacteroidales bacterium]
MKKITGLLIGVAAMALFTIPVQAQLRFGVKGGLNISSVRFDDDLVSADNVTGFHIGPTAELMVPLLGIGFDASLLYSQKVEQNYIEVPVNVKWKIGLPLVKGYIAAGPYIEFRLGDKILEGIGEIKEQWESKSFGAGLNFGAGVEVFNHLNIGFNYGLGLTNNYGNFGIDDAAQVIKGKSRVPAITVAYLF